VSTVRTGSRFSGLIMRRQKRFRLGSIEVRP